MKGSLSHTYVAGAGTCRVGHSWKCSEEDQEGHSRPLEGGGTGSPGAQGVQG